MNRKNIVCGTFLLIIIAVIISGLIYVYNTPIELSPPHYYYVKLNQTKVDNDYILKVRICVPPEVELKDKVWWIGDKDNVLRFMGDLPHVSGEKGSISDKNVTITWYDNDNNGKLSVNDSIKIKTVNYNLTGYSFKFGIEYEDGFETISHVDLE